jgi:cytochrome o ubiquinol oxidase subunit 2
MNDKEKIGLLLLVLVGILAAAGLYMISHDISLLSSSGMIASQERHLIIVSTLLMLIVVLPVYLMTFLIVWRYRESNTKAKYMPDWDHGRSIELTWWAIPGLIILILSVITWRSSHQLDPFRPITSSAKPITVQVVALQWKWLFIYPQQNVASVNYLKLPVATPISFEITADAPMNSLWIPKLGGQIYAMSGMSTKLHLIADTTGSYPGYSANVSGKGFSSMNFTADVGVDSDFRQWAAEQKLSSAGLDMARYQQLAKPSTSAVSYYSLTDKYLYDKVLDKYMAPQDQMMHTEHYQ